eukprot:scaffold652168_cov19-Prasinocladus_malaysianus.AAC.1
MKALSDSIPCCLLLPCCNLGPCLVSVRTRLATTTTTTNTPPTTRNVLRSPMAPAVYPPSIDPARTGQIGRFDSD